jgi:electron transport complex protein RnfC
MGLEPYRLNRLALLEDYDAFVDEGGMDCIECGSCSYTCPSMRYLVQSLREAKRTAGARRRK